MKSNFEISMSLKLKNTITFIFVLSAFNCSSTHDGYHVKVSDNAVYSSPNANGEYNYKQIEKDLILNIREFIEFKKDNNDKFSYGKFTFENIQIVIKRDHGVEFKKSVEEEHNIKIPFENVLINLDVQGQSSTKSTLEIDLKSSNPQFNIEYIISPKPLLALHNTSKGGGGISFVIFFKKIFAPKTLKIQTEVKLNVFIGIFKSIVSFFRKVESSETRDYSNKFTLWMFDNYNNVLKLKESSLSCIGKDGKKIFDYSGMFILEEKLLDFNYSAFRDKDKSFYEDEGKVKPDDLVIKLIDEKKNEVGRLRLNPNYADHLKSEGVYFNCKNDNCKLNHNSTEKYINVCRHSP